MRLALLTVLTMLAFAANSLLTRAAVDGGHIDPSGFAIIRVLAGATVLGMVITLRGGGLPMLRARRWLGAFCLTAYMIGFSLAYLTLDAGLGALILFGVTQITMFGYGAVTGTRPSARQLSGAAIAFLGLLVVLWPGPDSHTDLGGALLMVLAGVGWGAYTLLGRGGSDPLVETTASFVLCLPILLVLLVGTGLRFGLFGVALAIICGGLTSGLGYALWYAVLPRLQSSTAAVVQLSVPIIAILGGALVLGEPLTLTIALAATLVLGGIGWAVSARSVPGDHR